MKATYTANSFLTFHILVNSEMLASGPPFLGSPRVFIQHTPTYTYYLGSWNAQAQMQGPHQRTQIITSGWSHSGDDKNLSVTHF